MCIFRARPTTRDCFTQAWLQDSYLMKLRRQTLTFTSSRLKEFLVEQQCRRTEDATKHKVLLRTYQSSPQSPVSGTAMHVPSPKWDDGVNAAPHMSLNSWICPQWSKITTSVDHHCMKNASLPTEAQGKAQRMGGQLDIAKISKEKTGVQVLLWETSTFNTSGVLRWDKTQREEDCRVVWRSELLINCWTQDVLFFSLIDCTISQSHCEFWNCTLIGLD